jgi:hypothetical protein
MTMTDALQSLSRRTWPMARKNPEQAASRKRIRNWTRMRFALPEAATILVSELACTRPGCPPLATVVVFWTESEKRHLFRIFKEAGDVVLADLPPAWLKDALVGLSDGDGCCS